MLRAGPVFVLLPFLFTGLLDSFVMLCCFIRFVMLVYTFYYIDVLFLTIKLNNFFPIGLSYLFLVSCFT